MPGIDEIEKKLSSICRGYITHRKINGKTYHYRQWTEDGRQHSVRIPDDEVEALSREIEERKTLEKELKALKKRGGRSSEPVSATANSAWSSMTGLR